MPRPLRPESPFRYFNSSPEVIRLVVMMYVRCPLSLRNVEDLLLERGIDVCHETVRLWWNRLGPTFASDIRRQRANHMRDFRHWRVTDKLAETSCGVRLDFTGMGVKASGSDPLLNATPNATRLGDLSST